MKSGARHWLWGRVTAIASLPVSLWCYTSLVARHADDYHTLIAWLREPTSVVLLLVLLASMFAHIALGLEVVIEDYVHSVLKRRTVLAMRVGCAALFAAGCLAIIAIIIRG